MARHDPTLTLDSASGDGGHLINKREWRFRTLAFSLSTLRSGHCGGRAAEDGQNLAVLQLSCQKMCCCELV